MEGSHSGLPAGMPFDDKWERTFDAVPDLIMILDTEHRVVRANRALAERLGRAAQDLIGRSCYEVVHGVSIAPDVLSSLPTSLRWGGMCYGSPRRTHGRHIPCLRVGTSRSAGQADRKCACRS